MQGGAEIDGYRYLWEKIRCPWGTIVTMQCRSVFHAHYLLLWMHPLDWTTQVLEKAATPHQNRGTHTIMPTHLARHKLSSTTRAESRRVSSIARVRPGCTGPRTIVRPASAQPPPTSPVPSPILGVPRPRPRPPDHQTTTSNKPPRHAPSPTLAASHCPSSHRAPHVTLPSRPTLEPRPPPPSLGSGTC
jgi:hypothetical protein